MSATEKAYFAAGCFWGVETRFRELDGVVETQVGYQGGSAEQPTYEQVCGGGTGHAETVEVEFDPARISYEQLVRAFFAMHDPTTLNRQGPDVGTQYRSAIFHVDDDQKETAQAVKRELEDRGAFPRDIVTEISPAKPFWRAEEYHQRYEEKHSAGRFSIAGLFSR
jgi:peptide-methionine (S)-S-oxide reductase